MSSFLVFNFAVAAMIAATVAGNRLGHASSIRENVLSALVAGEDIAADSSMLLETALDSTADSDTSAMDTSEFSSGASTRSVLDYDLLGPLSHFKPWFSEEGQFSQYQGHDAPIGAIQCRGKYCDDKSLRHYEYPNIKLQQLSNTWTRRFSEETSGRTLCPTDSYVVQIKCTGSYCDNLELRCVKARNVGITSIIRQGGWVSEESWGQSRHCPKNKVLVGIQCFGRYCDNMHIYCGEVRIKSLELESVKGIWRSTGSTSRTLQIEVSESESLAEATEHGASVSLTVGATAGLEVNGFSASTSVSREQSSFVTNRIESTLEKSVTVSQTKHAACQHGSVIWEYSIELKDFMASSNKQAISTISLGDFLCVPSGTKPKCLWEDCLTHSEADAPGYPGSGGCGCCAPGTHSAKLKDAHICRAGTNPLTV